MVQFYGFDKIWEKLNNMKDILELSLAELGIASFGYQNYLKRLMPNLKVLSLESNLM